MHFWVDCTDASGGMVRYRFRENELRGSTVAAVSEADKAWSEAAAVKACEQQILSVATHPSTVSINKFGYTFQKFEPLGSVAVQMDFKAKNGFGLELKYAARCLYSPGSSTGEITVKERNG
jgi:hypothetical protein